ncbi:DUF4761 family protein [Escherichia coli]|uniref:DUF4761 family protein n=1 Tax=Escherichia coli TaxID=562 RepID=UPI003EEBE306
MKQRRNFRTETERQANRFATSASRSNIRYSLSETHATPDGHTVKQIGEHTWLIEKAGIRSLYDVAFYADDLDALNELSELICAAECGEHIEPYKLGNIA